jgi:hypothetical protein
VTRPGNDPRRSGSQPPSGKNHRQPATGADGGRHPGSVGRSTLWDEGGDTRKSGPQPPKVSRDGTERATRPAVRRPVQRRRSASGRFFHRYGWRAFAIPALVALTVLAIVEVRRPPASSAETSGVSPVISTTVSGTTATTTVTESPTVPAPAAAPAVRGSAVAPTSHSVSTGPVPSGTYKGLSSAALPPGENFVPKGKGTWHVVPGRSAPMGSGPTKYTFTVEVEDGIQNAQADRDFAGLVDSTLADPRSWIGSGSYTLQRIDSGTPSFRISLTSQLTARGNELCGWEIHYEASCYARDVQRVAINDARWARGAVSFNGDRGSYRAYAINHEVGHALGYSHQPCATNGGLAPVMMQQSWSTSNNDLATLNPRLIPKDGKVCKFNPYPYPLGSATGAATTTPATKVSG